MMAYNKLIELVTELDKGSYITYRGLRIQPKAVFFKNLIEGKTYKQKVRLQNIHAKPIVIRTSFPQACSFKLENALHNTSLSSGLTANIWIKYTHVQNSNVTATLRIFVGDECMHYPINVCMSFNYMYPIPRIINFGKINQTHSIYTETLEIFNKGFKTSKFAFDLANNPLGLLVKPPRGFVEPNSSTLVQISIVGIEEGQFYKEIWVKCDYPFRFAVSVEVVKPKLYILSPHVYTESFLPIQFPATYALCKNFKTLVVKNHNLLESNYIVVPEFHLDVMAMHKVKELEPSYSSFCFLPAVDGHLKPNEKKELHVSFQAKTVPSQKRDRIFFVCYRLIRLEIVNVNKLLQVKSQKKSISDVLPPYTTLTSLVEPGDSDTCLDFDDDSRSLSQVFGDAFVNNYEFNTTKSFNEYIRLCCYAVVKPVQVDVHPAAFELGCVEINSTKTLSITFRNRSNLLPIFYEYVKTAYIDVVPPKGMLDISQSVEISMTISPKRPGILDGLIKFDLLYYSYVDVGEREKVKVGKVLLGLQMNVRFPTAKIQPKFNPGITPLVAHEVGFLTDSVKFNSEDVEKPQMAMLGSYEINPAKKLSDSKIAFPNETRRSMAPWTKQDGKCKTIFTGVSRGIAPQDFRYARTSQEEISRQKNIDYYDRYIDKLHMKRINNLPPPMLPDYYKSEKKLLLKIDKPICPIYVKNSNDPILQGFPALTPSQTYFINVNPIKVNLGKIAVNSSSTFRIKVSNDNKFPCHIELKTLHTDACVFPSLPKTTILKASLSTIFEEVFCPIAVGRFHTILNFFINNRHSLPITFQADIVKPFVYVDNHSIIFDDKNGTHSRYIKLINTLNVQVVFCWQIPKLTCYSVEPSHGCIPVGRFIMCEVMYEPDAMKRSSARLQLACLGGTSTTVELNAYLLKCDVEYLKDRVLFENIPINIPVVKYNILRNNATEAVSFTIRNTKPCHGISIEPAFGTIWGRSDFWIKITAHYKYFAKFHCKVETEFDHGNYLCFHVTGNVDIPRLRVKPDNTKFTLRRIPAESFDVCPFSLLNRGNSELNISFDQVLFPEIKISRYADYLDTSEDLEINLAPDEMVELFVHFYPLDVCMNEFLVPVIINHLLGPPYKGEPDTLKPFMYTDEFMPKDIMVGHDECVKLLKLKTNIILPIISIYAISSRHVLRFNKTFFKFKYFPLKSYPSKTHQELKIRNSYHKAIEFSLNTDDIYPHFDINPVNHKKWNYCNNFIYCTVEPNEEMVLTVRFKHISPGLVNRRIEVFIKDVKNGSVFTYIKLRGRYLEATFKLPHWIFLQPVPLRVTLIKEVKLRMRNHLPNCKLNISCDDKDFMVTELPSKVEYSLIKDVTVKIEFVSDFVKQIIAKIYFNCSCGASAFTIVTASTDENIATIYAHFFKNTALQPSSVQSKYFPLFPSKADNSKIAVYMRKCKAFVERWIYEQAMHMTYYYFIPDSMMGLYKTSTKPRPFSDTLAIVKILQNICGAEVLPSIITRPYPMYADRLQQINYKHSVFKNILHFLQMHGAFFPHVRARYLLDYTEYVLYCTKVRTIKQKKVIEYDDYDEHYLRSEQCWLDLILQLFKSLVLASITFRKQRLSHVNEVITLSRVYDTDSQQALLQWLNDVYDSNISMLMELDEHKPADYQIPAKHITNFTNDLEDGLVLAAVTMHYCPYLRFILKDIYVKIDSPDKSYHNAILLIQAWAMVKCSFKILPEEITNPSALQMLLFVTYMYLVFPLLTPKEELLFNVSLSFMESHDIYLKNPSPIDLVFEISFLNNTMDCFEVIPVNTAVVPALKDLKLKVTYQAKKLENVTAVLVLAGDTPGTPYCKSIIYILKGITNFETERESITLSVDLYSMVERDILFRAPYECETTYDLIKEKCKLEKFNLEVFKTWKQTPAVIVPKSLYCSNCTMTTNEMGIGTVKMTVCCLSIAVEELILVFMNKTVGDFIVTLIIQPMNFQKIPKHNIFVQTPDNWESLMCICDKNKFVHSSKCPRYVTIHIPCRNDYFWSIITNSLLLAVPENDKPIWKEYLNGEMGPYLLNWLFVTANEPPANVKHIFESDIKYKVSNPYPAITLPQTVTIPNMRSNETVPIDVHIGQNVPCNRLWDFTLQSEDGGEYRIYTINLKKKSMYSLPQT